MNTLKQKYSYKWFALAALVTAVFLLAGFLVVGCEKEAEDYQGRWTDESSPQHMPVKPRWYTEAQVQSGYRLFQQHCATCHKPDASGAPNWRGQDAEGKYPPPPLNGTAHTWHHPLSVLRTVVRKGGAPVGGTMPAFGEKLDAQQIDEVLAWVQSNWPEDIYAAWYERNQQK
ncbi:MAG: c-type cytochrome [bacterium]